MNHYAETLSNIIRNSGIKLTEMARIATEMGEELTVSYISKLKNGKMPPPSYKISILLSQILEIEPRILLSAAQHTIAIAQATEMAHELKSVHPNKDLSELKQIAWGIITFTSQQKA